MKQIEKERLKEKLKIRLREHFDRFIEMEINNIKISIMPMENQIPELSLAEYDDKTDVLSIRFANDDTTETESHKIDDTIELILSKVDNKLIGIRVRKFSSILFEKISNELTKSIKMHEEKVHSISFQDVERRKVNFFTEIFENKKELLAI